MTRNEVCQEFGAWYQGQVPEEVHWWAAEAMADEIVRLRAILAMLRAPSEAVIVAMQSADSHGDVTDAQCDAMLCAAVTAAEQEVDA